MKVLSIILFFMIGQYAFAMGAQPLFPGKPTEEINDMVETTSGINQFSQDRGHQDQQMMEEKKVKEEKTPVKKLEKEKQIPIEKIKIYHE